MRILTRWLPLWAFRVMPDRWCRWLFRDELARGAEVARRRGWQDPPHEHVFRAVTFRNYCYCECGEKVTVWDSVACQHAFEHGPKMHWYEVPNETRN